MTAARFRRLALALEAATEGAHMGHADFRVQNRIFASLDAEEVHSTVALTPEQQVARLAAHPQTFEPAAGKWGLSGYTRVRLAVADEDAVGEALTLAWQNAVRKGPTKASIRKAVPAPRAVRKTPSPTSSATHRRRAPKR